MTEINTKRSKKPKKTKSLVELSLDALVKGLEDLNKEIVALNDKVANLESRIPKDILLPEVEVKPPKPKYLGKGVQKISKGNLEGGNMGDTFVREKGVTIYTPGVKKGL